jgi:predicted metalloprotease with PDZ domain
MKQTKSTPQFKIHYKVSTLEPQKHIFQIEMNVVVKSTEPVFRFGLPIWSPGSYFVRNYSGNIIQIYAVNNKGAQINIEQTDLSIFEIVTKEKEFTIHYSLYAFENTVRTNYLTSDHGFINSPSTFLYPLNNLQASIKVEFPKLYFKNVYTALNPIGKAIYETNDYDELFDSPFFLSNEKSINFKSAECDHEIIIEGNLSNHYKTKLVKDLIEITKFQSEMFGGNPNKYYLFILKITDNVYGGLEHKMSSVNFFPAFQKDDDEYKKLLGLLCHEYFHLWNVKRIRPFNLGPFDYNHYVLTKELWIAEGITSFYDNYILYLTNILSKQKYLNEIANDWNRLELSQGEEYMSLEESSFTAWTKYYKQNPDSHNYSISYYIKGSILALCMDISIRDKSKLKYNLSTVLNSLYKNYYLKQNRGFTKEEFFKTAFESTGVDIYSEFKEYIETNKRIPLDLYFEKLEISIKSKPLDNLLPFETKTEHNTEVISKIYNQFIGNLDISLGDELIAINNKRIKNKDFSELNLKPKQMVNILLSRNGKVINRKLKLHLREEKIFDLDPFAEVNSPLHNNFFDVNRDK